MTTHFKKGGYKRKNKKGIWYTNKFGKPVNHPEKHTKNKEGKCIKCKKPTKHHHWLCDDCWQKEFKKGNIR